MIGFILSMKNGWSLGVEPTCLPEMDDDDDQKSNQSICLNKLCITNRSKINDQS